MGCLELFPLKKNLFSREIKSESKANQMALTSEKWRDRTFMQKCFFDRQDLNYAWINCIGDNFWFWSKQWDTHGTCSYADYNQYQFFDLALTIYFRHPLLTILANLKSNLVQRLNM
ncbi:ribonuclease T2 family protein [Medicago truncatula]|uniref:Ribonuclease T2 family protein n=1 Tax=Medicago truncatula TaxID=3880 RepID=G7KHZ3_MEDTR|nr:ribonuclease T2 family protein [Medicago truncatula]